MPERTNQDDGRLLPARWILPGATVATTNGLTFRRGNAERSACWVCAVLTSWKADGWHKPRRRVLGLILDDGRTDQSIYAERLLQIVIVKLLRPHPLDPICSAG
ncbi:MAG: hypothetical protein H7288_12855 [Kineosporiaceae bacterium]|nr:hypothetical protein [Aeromicrobium sp.]